MLDSFFKIDFEKVAAIEWDGTSEAYDQKLYELGEDHESFIVYNPFFEDHTVIDYLDELPETDKCIVIIYDNDWVAKIFTQGWDVYKGYKEKIITKPKYSWTKNPDIDRLMTFIDDPFGNFDPKPWDSRYTLVWYLDPRFNPTEDKIWAMTCKPIGKKTVGIKEMGYLTPDVTIEFNSEVPDFKINLDNCFPSYTDAENEYAWKLDPIHTDGKDIWVVKFKPNYRKPRSWQWAGIITPQYHVEYNPALPNFDYDLDYVIPFHDLAYEHVWMLDRKHLQNGEDDIWAFKIKLVKDVQGSKIIGDISPAFQIELNPDLPEMEYETDYVIPFHDLAYEHVWFLDKKHLQNGEDDIWAFKLRCVDKIKGTKDIGYISPKLYFEYNQDLPELNYTIDYAIPFHDLAYEHVWMLDRKHLQNGEDDIWAVKIKCVDTIKGTKNIDYISPNTVIEYNSNLPKLEYDIDYVVPWHDLSYEHVWMLDRKHLQNNEDDIWAFKISYAKTSIGSKQIDFVSPNQKMKINTDLPKFVFDIDYVVPWHDFGYEHVWFLDKQSTKLKDKIWVITLKFVDEAKGQKEIGKLTPLIQDNLDVIFISYKEENAEINWKRVLEKAPWAKRVQGVNGIFNAHKAAADLATTDMFYVVDGDAYLVDDWEFNYQPGIFDRDCAYVWYSINPINDLTYGYGGVKLFSKEILAKKKKWTTLDMFTGIMPKIKIEDKVSCVTSFNVNPFSTWRSAFRECVKLFINNQTDRLQVWTSKGKNKPFGSYAIGGAKDAIEFAKKNLKNQNELLKINDFNWLEQKFKEKYKNV